MHTCVLKKPRQIKNGQTPYAHIGISVGSKNHEGERLATLVEFARKNFEHVIVEITDDLYRFNFMAVGVNELAARYQARLLGDEWIERNIAVISGATLLRWNDIAAPSNEQFRTYKIVIENAAMESQGFKDALGRDIQNFARRAQSFGIEMTDALSQQYLIEEIAGLCVLQSRYPATEIYPGPELKCMKFCRDGGIPGLPLIGRPFAQVFIVENDNDRINHKNDDETTKGHEYVCEFGGH